MKPDISVIIPTYNRPKTLIKCLEAILANNFTRPYEVVIIDDASSVEAIAEIFDFIRKKDLNNFVLLRQEKGGPAKARNLGINQSQSDLLLFIGDDSMADKDLLEEHYIWNTQKYPRENVAILGHNEWSPEIKVTPFMKWIDKTGLQFSYNKFIDENSPDPEQLWTCNISLKKSFLEKYGKFDEDFPYAAWEDVELGWRLSKHNFQIKYNKYAIVYHDHPTSVESIKRRMFRHGFSQMILAEKMGKEYHNKFFRQPLKFFLNTLDMIITLTGILFILEHLAKYLENKKIIPAVYYPVLFHYKLAGNKKYEKIKK